MNRFPVRSPLCSLFVLTLAACPADETPVDETSPSDEGSTTETSTGDGDGDTDSAGDGDGDATDTEEELCGNGDLDEGEECDDGNDAEGDGCSASCVVTSCGLKWSVTEDIPNTTPGGFDVAVGDDGSIYTTGQSVNADNDLWAAKWNPDGSVAYSVSIDGGAGNDAGFAIVLGDGGEVYIGGRVAGDGEDMWYGALDASGSEQWSVTSSSEFEGEDDLITGIDLDPNGDLILTGRIRAGDGDDDVWIRKASAADGSEIWTTTWTGPGNGMFSIERGGQVSAAPDGTYWVTGREYIDGTTQEATLLHVDADGNIVATYQPQAGGGEHSHNPVAVLAGSDAVYFTFDDTDFPYSGWLYKLGLDGSEQWLKTEADWVLIGDTWRVRGLGFDGDGNLQIVGLFDNEEAGEALEWGEGWTAKLDGAGEIICRSQHMVDDGAFLPPSLSLDGAGASPGGMGLVGIETPAQGMAYKLWTGYFLP